jgi:hypothetical protein
MTMQAGESNVNAVFKALIFVEGLYDDLCNDDCPPYHYGISIHEGGRPIDIEMALLKIQSKAIWLERAKYHLGVYRSYEHSNSISFNTHIKSIVDSAPKTCINCRRYNIERMRCDFEDWPTEHDTPCKHLSRFEGVA